MMDGWLAGCVACLLAPSFGICFLIATSLQPIILSGNPSSSGFHWNFSQLVVESIDFCGE
jgi:hypothetical protein